MILPILDLLHDHNLIEHFKVVIYQRTNNNEIDIKYIIMPDADVLKLTFINQEHGQILLDHLFQNNIGSIKNGNTVKKVLQPDGKHQWAIYIRDDQLLAYCQQVFFQQNIDCDELELIRRNRALVKVTPVSVLFGNNVKAIDYFFEQVADPVRCRRRRPLNPSQKRSDYWDPTDGQYHLRKTPPSNLPTAKPQDYEYTKKEPFSLLPANGKMKLINKGAFGMNRGSGIGLLFDLAYSYLKRSKYTGKLNYIFKADAATNSRFWLGGYKNIFTYLSRSRAVSLHSLIEYNNDGNEKFWNELLPCVSQKGFRAIFDYNDTLDSRLNLIFYKIYLEKKYPFILKKFPLGIPLLIITPEAGAKKYIFQDQILDLLEGISANNNIAHNIDKAYFIQYITDNKIAHIVDKEMNVEKVLGILHDSFQVKKYVDSIKQLYKSENLSSYIRAIKWAQIKVDYNIDDFREAYRWTMKESHILILQGIQLVHTRKMSLSIFLSIVSFVFELPDENTFNLFNKITCEMSKKFIDASLEKAESSPSTCQFFSPSTRNKINVLRQLCRSETTLDGLQKVIESHKNNELYPDFLERHHKRIGKITW